jgi:hypothetical protein
MPFKPDEYHAALNKRGVAKASYFEVKIHGIDLPTERDMIFRAETAELPGRTLSTNEHRIYGPIRKIPYASTYTDTSVTILCSRDLSEKVYFENWQNLIHNHQTDPGGGQYNLGYYNDYIKSVLISTYDEQGMTTSEHTFNEAYPVGIAPISLSWSSDELIKLQITFAYKDYSFNNNFQRHPLSNPKEYLKERETAEIDRSIVAGGF